MEEKQTHNIHKAIAGLAVPINNLRADPDNAKEHSKRSIEVIASSLRKFGQDQVVVARRDGIVVKGSGRLEAARSLGWTHVAAVYVDEGEDQSKGRAVADNKTAELSSWDRKSLAGALKRLQKSANISPGEIGFTPAQFERLVNPPAADTVEEPNAAVEDEPKTEEPPGDMTSRIKNVSCVKLVFSSADYALIEQQLEQLAKIYQTETTGRTVLEAMRRVSGD